jgi:hypothetical protein
MPVASSCDPGISWRSDRRCGGLYNRPVALIADGVAVMRDVPDFALVVRHACAPDLGWQGRGSPGRGYGPYLVKVVVVTVRIRTWAKSDHNAVCKQSNALLGQESDHYLAKSK